MVMSRMYSASVYEVSVRQVVELLDTHRTYPFVPWIRIFNLNLRIALAI